MKRRLLGINLLLLALVCSAAWLLRERAIEAREREARMLRQKPSPARVPPFVPAPPPQPAAPANYLGVAEKMLFTKDRNPNVIIDPVAPPPPKPMPALPTVAGVVDFGEGPTVIMSEKPGAQHKGYRLGQKVGEFKLLAVNNRDILLEWDGQRILRKIEELKDKAAPPPEPAPAAAAQPAPSTTTTAAVPARQGPGADLGNETKACQPGDSAAPGTVSGGFRKVVTRTPFGDSCRWEPVK